MRAPAAPSWAEKRAAAQRSARPQPDRRRHLDESQRAMVAARLATMKSGSRTDLASIEARSQPDAADAMNVSRASVQRAQKVLNKGEPELVKGVESGKVLVNTAASAVDLSAGEQRKIAGAKNPAQEAKKIRRQKNKTPKTEPRKGERQQAGEEFAEILIQWLPQSLWSRVDTFLEIDGAEKTRAAFRKLVRSKPDLKVVEGGA